MNFFKLFVADFKKDFWLISIMILLISVTLCLSLLSILSERSLRLGSASAADKFDLVIGAKGSEVQLVLSSVFLKPASLDLIDSKILDDLKKDQRVKWASPVGFGDFYKDFPVIGISKDMIQSDIKSGKNLNAMFDAVVGIDTRLKIGDTFSPMHGHFKEAGAHLHENIVYEVVGIKKRDNSAWDKSILVNMEAVWHAHADHEHSHGHSHEHESEHLHENHHDDHLTIVNNLDSDDINHTNKTNKQTHNKHINNHDKTELTDTNKLGIPAIVVKPVSFIAAYQLRQDYKNKDDTIAVFPGEILAWLYSLLGDTKSWLLAISTSLQVLAFMLVFGLSFLFINQKKAMIIELRVFGANVFRIMIYVWAQLISIILSGIIIGTILGFLLTKVVSSILGDKLGFSLITKFECSDFVFLAFIFLVSAVLCFIPVIKIYKISVANSLKDN